jgi:hypothetical protein
LLRQSKNKKKPPRGIEVLAKYRELEVISLLKEII